MMQQIQLSKREFRNWLAGLIAVPIGIFILGLTVGLNLTVGSKSVEPTVVSTAPMALPMRAVTTPEIESGGLVSLQANEEEPAPVLTEVELSSLEPVAENIADELPTQDQGLPAMDQVTLSVEDSVANEQADEEIASEPTTLASKLMVPNEALSIDVKAMPGPVYSFQVGSFSSRANADSFRTQLSEKGYPVNDLYTDTRPPNITTYKVRIGEYASREEAAVAASRYHEKEQAPVFIIPPYQASVSSPSI